MTQPRCHDIAHAGTWSGADDSIALTYDGRFLRRRALISKTQIAFLVDLPKTVSVDQGCAFRLTDGRHIAVTAADEDVLRVTGPDLVRLAWHVGNRHTPCQIAPDHLLIQANHVMADMLSGLGADIQEMRCPFTPEGGAYGHGRTHGHSH